MSDRLRLRPRVRGAIGRVLLRRERIALQARQRRVRGGGARGDRVARVLEVGEAERAQLGREQHVVGRELLALGRDVLADQDADHLLHHVGGRRERVERAQRRADVDGDHDVRAHLPRGVDGQVADEPAVHERAAVDLGGREQPRHRHARANRERQRAVVEHDHLPGLQIGRDRAIGERQLIERLVGGHARRPVGQQRLQPVALHEADRRLHAVRTEAERQAVDVKPLVLAAALRQVRPLGRVERDVGEIDLRQATFHVAGSHAARVQPADHGAHAGAGDAIHRNAVFLEHFQHAQMRIAARAAAGQHEPDRRAARIAAIGRARVRGRQGGAIRGIGRGGGGRGLRQRGAAPPEGSEHREDAAPPLNAGTNGRCHRSFLV